MPRKLFFILLIIFTLDYILYNQYYRDNPDFIEIFITDNAKSMEHFYFNFCATGQVVFFYYFFFFLRKANLKSLFE